MDLSKSDINALTRMLRLYVERGWNVEAGLRAVERYAEAEAQEAGLRSGRMLADRPRARDERGEDA